MRALCVLLPFTLLACGAATSSTDAGTSTGADAGMPMTGGDAGTHILTLNNEDVWCTITVNGTAQTVQATENLSFPAGTAVTLNATPLSSSFIWGSWSVMTGTGSPMNVTTMTTSVTMTADVTASACCPISGQTSCP